MQKSIISAFIVALVFTIVLFMLNYSIHKLIYVFCIIILVLILRDWLYKL